VNSIVQKKSYNPILCDIYVNINRWSNILLSKDNHLLHFWISKLLHEDFKRCHPETLDGGFAKL
jgi:hypothetical protein